MRPRWELKEHTLIKYLRECVWSLERVESRINMIRHSWSTPCFIPEEVEPPPEGGAPAVALRPHAQQKQPRPRSCVSPREFEEQEAAAAPRPLSCISNRDDDDDDDVPLYLEGAAGGPEAASSEGTSAVTTPDPSTTPSARVSPSRSSSPPQSLPSPGRCASPSPSRASTRSTLSPARSRVIYRKRKTSMPLPIRIPEDREAYCQSPLFSPLGSPPTSAGGRKQLEYGSGGAGIPLSPTVRRSVDESTLWRRRTGGYASGGAGRQASTEEVRRRRESFASLSPHHLSAGSIHHATGKRRCICRMPFSRAVSNYFRNFFLRKVQNGSWTCMMDEEEFLVSLCLKVYRNDNLFKCSCISKK
ncbi:uncharacterized protein [Penaeus vannamei]|uniref:uncharacterized protein n=1 Tax=Penaeus vannamei TaxID=6689 RepID=UPI00387F4E77